MPPLDERSGRTLSVCIVTARRPDMLARLLQNLANQTRIPHEILVVDASPDDATAKVVANCKALFGSGILRRQASPLGVTRQRNLGIDQTTGDLLCMVDDDVLLELDCLELMKTFMESPEGQQYGAVGAYVTNEYGRRFNRVEVWFRQLGIYQSLTPGRWLYCGDFIELSRLQPFEGVHRTQFLSGCVTMWRRSVFDQARPDDAFQLPGEDKHLSLRVSQFCAVGVLGHAHIQHSHYPGGVRQPPFARGVRSMRNRATMLRECDPNPSVRRYVAHLLYQPLELSRLTVLRILGRRWRELTYVAGLWIGWLSNAFWPPHARRPAAERRKIEAAS